MANKTTNYNLTKPLPEDFYDINVHNANMDIIDAELKKRATLDNGKVPTGQLPIGTANGVAGLNDKGQIATSILPIGTAGGVAGLDKTGKLPAETFPEGVGGGGKRTARFTVGSSQYGWTDSDCDYLCDGIADDVEINAAIQALRSTGGEVVLLDGIYNITAEIELDTAHQVLTGNGANTRLVRAFTGDPVIYISGGKCTVRNLAVDGVKGTYTATTDYGICSYSSNNTIENCTIQNTYGYGIYISADNHIIRGNRCEGNGKGISDHGSYNLITENVCNGNEYGIEAYGDHGVITGNTCRLNSAANIRVYLATYYVVTNNNCTVLSADATKPTYALLIHSYAENTTVALNLVGEGTLTNSGENTILLSEEGHTHSSSDITGIETLLSGAAKVQMLTYIGTGTTGSSNPTILTFNFAPKVIFCLICAGSKYDMYGKYIAVMEDITTSYAAYQFGDGTQNKVKKSSDGKTVYVYNENSVANSQFNGKNNKYKFFAIG